MSTRLNLLFFLLFLVFAGISQTNKDIRLSFRDVHLADVEQVLMDPAGNYFFTADANGKILMWDALNFKVLKTIQEETGVRITRMTFIDNGKTIVCTTGSQGRYVPNGERNSYSYNTDYDKLMFYSPYSNDSVNSMDGTADLLSLSGDTVLMIATGENSQGTLIAVDPEDVSKEYFRIQSEKVFSKAAISKDCKTLAYTEYDYSSEFKDEYTLKIVRTDNQEMITSKRFVDEKVVSIVFAPDDKSLHLLIFNRKDRKMRVEGLDMGTLKLKKYLEIEMTDAPDRVLIQDTEKGDRTLILTGMFSSDHILHFNKEQLEILKTGLEDRTNRQTISAMAFVPNSDYIIFWNSINAYFGVNPEFVVWNKKARTDIIRFYEPPRTENRGVFLPEDNWMVFGKEANQGSLNMLSPMQAYFKFYEAGTFNNRFGQLKFVDYINQKYKVSFYSEAVEIALDETSGTIAFVASLPSEEVYSDRLTYLFYDLLKDELDTMNSAKVDYMIPVQLVKAKNRLLVKKCITCKEYSLIEGNKQIDFKGEFTNAHLSKSGDYLMFVSPKGELTIHSLDNKKVVFRKSDEAWKEYSNVKMGTGDVNEFWISYITPDTIPNRLKYSTLVLNCSEEEVQETKIDKIWISGASTANGVTALIMDGLGVSLGAQKIIPFGYYQTPRSVSLNSSGKRLMVSHSNGTVEIYDTESLQQLGVMYHPDPYSYIMIDEKGNYASNTSPDDFLKARNENDEINFETLVTTRNHPEKLLELFGVPDQNYLQFLELGSMYFKTKSTEFNALNCVIKNIRFNNQTNCTTTETQTVNVELIGFNSSAEITQMNVTINNVSVLSKTVNIPKGEDGRISFSLNLYPGENTIKFLLADKDGNLSSPIYRTVFYDHKSKEKGDLYVLAIGISDYPGDDNDLTFADKDALDLALIYSDTLSSELKSYQNSFLGRRYTVQNGEKEYKEIRQYNGAYDNGTALRQVDMEGRMWLESINYEEYYLWDFKNGERTKINIKLKIDPLTETLYVDPTNQGFCFLSDKGDCQYFSFQSRQTRAINKPKDWSLLYMGDEKWLRLIESVDQSINSVKIGFGTGDEKIGSFEHAISFEDENNFRLLATTMDASSILIASFSNIYLVNKMGGDSQAKQLKWSGFNDANSFSFTADGKYINCFKTVYGSEKKARSGPGEWFISYDIAQNKLDSVFYENPDFSQYIGLNNLNGTVRWINNRSPIAKEEGFMSNESELRGKIKPISFDETHVMVLLNEQATKESISSNIDDFFKNATANDEVILFFAGHGMLDSALNFHFASYDMDFKQPDLKGISYKVIMDKLGQLPMSRKLLLLDACHSGNLMSPIISDTKNDQVLIAGGRGGEAEVMGETQVTDHLSDIYDLLFGAQTDQNGVTVIAASSGANLAYESGELSNGALTGAYIESILSGFRSYYSSSIDPTKVSAVPLTNDTIYYFRKKVLNDTKGLQIPSIRSFNNKVRIMLY